MESSAKDQRSRLSQAGLLVSILIAAQLSMGCSSKPGSTSPTQNQATSEDKRGKFMASSAKDGPSDGEAPWTLRSPSQIMTEGNHLKSTGSVYLQQHALNPLEWYPWGPKALERAQREDKPIFLSIGYASCHWCHVMEHEVFEKPEVAAFMNEHFVNIKVDREERPDIDAIYMDAVQAMTGRGGWPMTVLLTPSLKPFFGGTYFPKPRFMGIVKDALRRFKETRDQIEQDGDQVYAAIAQAATPQAGVGVQSRALKQVIERAITAFDAEWGGRQGRMKFPTPIRWRFLLQGWRKWGGEALERGIRRTLDQMAAGGIQDQLGGGFHRYTTEPTWLVPHFEKMLYDNAQLATLYFEAAAGFSEPRYAAIGRRTLDFMLKEMSNKGIGFYASYDADSGGEEGTFYVWRPSEIAKVVGQDDAQVINALLGITEEGNFEHQTSIPTWRSSFEAVANKLSKRPSEVEATWLRAQPKLYDARSLRVWPGLDKKLVTSWNGLAIEALALGYASTGEARYLKAAEDTAELLWRNHRRDDGGLYRASNDGVPLEMGVLDDYAFLAVGLLALFEVSGNVETLERARSLVAEAQTRFSREGGGYYFAEATDQSLIIRSFDTYDAVRPSGNSAMFEAELRLAALAGQPSQLKQVTDALDNYATLSLRSGLNMAGWHRAALATVGPFYEVIIAGDPDASETQALLEAYTALGPSWAVRLSVGQEGPTEALLAALSTTSGKRSRGGKASAYVCQMGSCKAPTSDPEVLKAQVLAGWHR